MKREALYHADTNELEELRQIEAPSISPNEFIEGTDEYIACFIAWQNYLKHCNSLRRLPCSPQPGFKDREIYVENEHYEVKDAGEWKWCAQLKGNYFAVPIVPVKSDDELYIEVVVYVEHELNRRTKLKDIIYGLQKHFIITKR